METPEVNTVIAAKSNFVVYSGDTLDNVYWRFWMDVLKTIPMDISLDTFKMIVKDESGAKHIIEFTIGDGLLIQSPNKLKINKTAFQMQLPQGCYQYDLQRTEPSGRVKTYVKGKFEVVRDITDL